MNPEGNAAEDFINNGTWKVEYGLLLQEATRPTSLKARIGSSDEISTDLDHSDSDSLFASNEGEEKDPLAEAKRFEEQAIVHCRRIHINEIHSYNSRFRERSGSSVPSQAG